MNSSTLAPKTVSATAFAAAQNFIETKARPLEQARFKAHFQNGPVGPVLKELSAYQNTDGGFGSGLEPDLRTPESSALCTTIAFQILGALQPKFDSGPAKTMAEKGIAYLSATVDQPNLHWRIIPPSAAHSPRAPWWHEDGRGSSFDEFSLNPTAEILGILADYGSLIPNSLPAPLVEQIMERVMDTVKHLGEIEMHDLYCCLRLQRANNLPEQITKELRERLAALVNSAVVTDPTKWGEYGLRPLNVVDSPSSPFVAGLEEAVAANLDFEIAEQNEDGSWMPTWSWGDLYPDEWETAKLEWAGMLTLGKLLLLRKFGRIEQ